jgi:chromosome segregation ATPase
LQSVVSSLHLESDARINEVSEARDAQDHAEAEVKRLQNVLESLERDTEARALEVSDARDRAEGEVQRLNVLVQTLQNDTGAKSKEISDARDRAEGEVERLETVIQTIQHEHAAQTEEMKDSLYRAESEVKRLEDIIDSMHNDNAVQHEEIRNARDHAESEVTRLQVVIESMKHDSAAQIEEVRGARDRAESEVKRLQDIIDSLQNDTTTRGGEALEARERAEQEVAQLEAAIQQIRNQSDARVKEADDQRAQSDANAARLQNEMTELEGEIVRVTTELTMVKAELDGAYGTRAERAAEFASNPSVQKENDALVTRNIELTEELALLKSQRGGGDLQQRADTLERELRETIDDYEAMTKASIEFEKERERFESFIDSLRDRCEQLETQLAEERISWMNLSSPTSVGRDGASETTSTMVLKNEFKKMMRDTRNENMKILRVSFFPTYLMSQLTDYPQAEQEERRRIEGLLRALRKEHAQVTGKMPSSGGTPL